MKTFKYWCISMLTLIVLIFVVYGIHVAQKQLDKVFIGMLTPISILLNVVLWCLIILVIGATVLAFAYAVSYLWKHHTTTEISEIGQHGTVLITRGKHQIVSPYIPTTISEVREKKVKEIEEKKDIAPMSELLRTGYMSNIIANGQMLLGFNQSTSMARLGTIEDNRTTGIAGKSRSGKTVTTFFLILQYVLAGAKVYILDKAWNKPSSLYNLVLPLVEAGYVQVARTPMETTAMTSDFSAMIERREQNLEGLTETKMLIVDEWTSYMNDKAMMKLLAKLMQKIANELAGYNVYGIVGGQNWQASQAGGNALINSLASFFVHKIDYMESKRVIERKYATLTEKLGVGKNFFKDTSGEVEKLVTPLCLVSDCYIVIAILEGLKARKVKIETDNMFSYQSQFQDYAPKKLKPVTQESTPVKPVPNHPLEESNAYVFQSKQRSQDLSKRVLTQENLIPDLVSEDKNVRVTPDEQKKIQQAIENAKQAGKVKANGKIVRTYVRDTLGYDARGYKKIEVYCNANNY